jgi:thymidylate synthase
MHIFLEQGSLGEAHKRLAAQLLTEGAPVLVKSNVGTEVETTELQNVLISFKPNFDNYFRDDVRKLEERTIHAEFLWYMTGIRNANVVAKYLPNWLKYVNHENGTVASNYGHYWLKHIPNVVSCLKSDPHSRRAVFNIYESSRFHKYLKDTPCTLTVSFNIRRNKLNMHCHMRSNDIWYGFPIDVFCNSQLHMLVYNELLKTYPTLEMGEYLHQADSLHAYLTDRSAMVKKLEAIAMSSYESKHIDGVQGKTLWDFWSESPKPFDWAMFDHFRKRADIANRFAESLSESNQ